jgi:HEAT repeat protein
VQIASRETTLALPSPGKPLTVIFDEGNTILKQLHFRRPAGEWVYQAQHAEHAIDRILAVQELAKDTTAAREVGVLAAIAGKDPFYAVRREAVRGLTDVRVPTAAGTESALVAATADGNAAVRSAAASGLARYRSEPVRSALNTCLGDSSYAVMAAAMSSLARVDSAHAKEWLPRYLGVPSRNEVLASTALGLISRADSVQGVALAMQRIRAGNPDRVRGQALSILRRPLKQSPEVEQIFIGLLHDRIRWVRSSAMSALRDNGGKASLAPLEAVAADADNDLANQAREAAEKVAARLKDSH